MDRFNIGFVGNGHNKFTALGAVRAKNLIAEILEMHSSQIDNVISGHSPLGGIDIWAEDYAEHMGYKTIIHNPEIQQWNPPEGYGYKARNLDIAMNSDLLCVIVANKYPPEYKGKKFDYCYHCRHMRRDPYDHVKSGGCWTGLNCIERGNRAEWFIIENG
jgi:hypothetical protein